MLSQKLGPVKCIVFALSYALMSILAVCGGYPIIAAIAGIGVAWALWDVL